MKTTLAAGVAIGVTSIATILLAATPGAPPVAPRIPVTDDYYGTKVTDDYRWMEDRKAPKFVSWITAENAYARAVLAQIPKRDELLKRISSHTGGGAVISSVTLAGGKIFYLKRMPAEDSFKLYKRASLSAPETVLVDPTRSDTSGKHFAIDYFRPSQDGTSLAYGISEGGSEDSVIHILDIASGKEAAETIDRCEGANPSWRADGKSFFYRRQAKLAAGAGELSKYLNSVAYLHIVGTDPDKDVPIIGNGIPGSLPLTPASEPFVYIQPGSRYAFAAISPGAVPEAEFFIAPADQVTSAHAPWKRVATLDDKMTNVAQHGDRLFLATYKGAPRFKVIELNAADPDMAKAKTVVPAGARVIEDIEASSDALYIRDLDGGPGRLRRYDFASGALADIALPAEGALSDPVTDPNSADVLFGLQGWVLAQRWYAYTRSGVVATDLAPPWADDLSAYVADEVKAPAPDGTLIPLSIVHKKGLKLDGRNPVWLGGYGA